MFDSLFPGRAELHRKYMVAACPDFRFIGEGRWYVFDQHRFGYPIVRLFDSERRANEYRDSQYIDDQTVNLQPRHVRYAGGNNHPVLPDGFPAWVSFAEVERNGPMLKGHLYREVQYKTGPLNKGRRERVLECLNQTPNRGLESTHYGFRPNWDFRILVEHYTPGPGIPETTSASRVGEIINLPPTGRASELTYLGPPNQ